MILFERFAGLELAYYRALKRRVTLSAIDARNLLAEEKGYAGECTYDRIFDEVGHDSVLVFRDIYLGIEGRVAQYDSLIVSNDGIVVNEIKNYSGNYRYDKGTWYIGKSPVSDDALSQLRRAVGKLVKLRYQVRGKFNISGKVIFPNIEFRLQSIDDELWDNVVLRSGLRSYLSQFQNMHAGRAAEDIAELIRNHIVPNTYFDKCADFSAVRKGLYCSECGGFELENRKYHLVCESCGSKETKETHILRAISDYKALFLNEKLTKRKFQEFIDYQVSRKTVFRLLNKYCHRHMNGSGSYYTFKYRSFEDAYSQSERLWRYKDYPAE
ncbi:MAG: nuclease-related domain-containing protein [Jeotgalicoccus sp.]|nr:nuclease-related domain-containing protein [Jeotgalicoccus sp.]